MGAHRPAYIAIFVAASLVAAGVYWFAQPRAAAVRARADIPVLTAITADMVELVQVPPAARPGEAATSLEAVVGQQVDRRGAAHHLAAWVRHFAAGHRIGHPVPVVEVGRGRRGVRKVGGEVVLQQAQRVPELVVGLDGVVVLVLVVHNEYLCSA